LNPPEAGRKLDLVAFTYRRPIPPEDPHKVRRPAPVTYGAGNYVGCTACGRLLKIEWAVRSLVCSCGAQVVTSPRGEK
jgi:hypothetical protein